MSKDIETLRRRYEREPDEVLLDIAEGRDLGYRMEAVSMARRVLDSRGVPCKTVPFYEVLCNGNVAASSRLKLHLRSHLRDWMAGEGLLG